MKLPIKKGWLIAIGIATILTFSNPTLNEFHEYKNEYCGKREAYCFIFSIFRCRNSRYIGFAKNFIYLKEVE